MAGFSGASAVKTCARTCYPFLRTRLRVHQAPGIPHALSGLTRLIWAKRFQRPERTPRCGARSVVLMLRNEALFVCDFSILQNFGCLTSEPKIHREPRPAAATPVRYLQSFLPDGECPHSIEVCIVIARREARKQFSFAARWIASLRSQ